MGEPACPTFKPTDAFLAFDTWPDIHPPRKRCDVHCVPCYHLDRSPGTLANGSRWLHPLTLVGSTHREGRDAWGKFHALRSNQPHLYPVVTCVMRAPCWINARVGRPALECYGATSCACDPALGRWVIPEGDTRCQDGTEQGHPHLSMMADTLGFIGHEFGNALNWMHCRREQSPPEIEPHPVRMLQGPINQAMWIRTSAMPMTEAIACTANFCIDCVGEQQNTECLDGDPHYFNDPGRAIWQHLYLTEFTGQLNRPSVHPESPADDAALEVQNAALAYVGATLGGDDPPSLNNLIHDSWDHPNSHPGYWTEGYGSTWAGGSTEPPVFVTLDNCRLRYSGCPVTVRLVIVRGEALANLALHKVIRIGSEDDEAWASWRLRVQVWLGATAELQGACQLHRPWREPPDDYVDLTIVNPTDYTQPWPRVQDDLDVIEYVDDQGRVFNPPFSATWNGSRQALSEGEGVWENLWADGSPEQETIVHIACEDLAHKLSPYKIIGAPTNFSSIPMIAHYLGHAMVGFSGFPRERVA